MNLSNTYTSLHQFDMCENQIRFGTYHIQRDDMKHVKTR